VSRAGTTELVQGFLDLAVIEGLSGREGSVAAEVRRRLEALGLSVEEEPPADGGEQGNLVCPVNGGGGVVLGCHLDTARSTSGLRPVVHPDRVTSDGTTVLGVDNRAGVAVLLQLARAAVRREVAAGAFTLVFTVREETDLMGSRSLELRTPWRHAFVFDSSLRPGRYIFGSYGAKRFEGRVEGRAAHAGIAPERGADAIRAAAAAIAGMPLGRIDGETTANIGRVEGGAAINTVPDLATFEGEVRALTGERIDEVVAEIRGRSEQASRLFGTRAEVEAHWDFHPFRLEEDGPVCRRLDGALRRAGLDPEPAFSSGGSDANWLNARGLPTVNVGIGAQNPHSNDELILIEDLEAAFRIAACLVEEEASAQHP
jgi:tripeptide aminopeptidase